MTYASFIWTNIARNPRRTILTIVSIGLSLFVLSTLMTVLTELNREPEGEDTHLRLVVRRATSLADRLPEAYAAKLQRVPGVRLVHALTWFGGIYIDERNFFANFACDPDTLFAMFPENRIPPEQIKAFRAERIAAIAGRKLVERFKWRLGDRITLQGTIYPVDLEFVLRGIYTGTDETAFFFHRAYLEEALGRPGKVGTFWLKAASAGDIPRIMDAVDTLFKNSDAETKTETERAFQLGFISMLGNVKTLIASISSVVVFTILLVTANTMAMSIRERAREIAILKTLGFGRRRLLGVLMGESAVIALTGGVLGCVGARLFFSVVDVWRYTQGLFPIFIVEPSTVLLGIGLSVLIGLASAALPAIRVSRLTIAEALRRVG
ncbi:MAG: FtsX-like permease family protein [candidate division NC10 bacterium]|nr:FtsX-like permease family protein [candidate division NC10 bacterium]MBI2457484.1 FtsX-like permease family protein [candidate division NC10 bacterium]